MTAHGKSGSRNTIDRAKAGSCKREQSHTEVLNFYGTTVLYAKMSTRKFTAAIMDVVSNHLMLPQSVYDKICFVSKVGTVLVRK